MIEIQNTLLHEDLITESFVCNLNKCKGICCVEGDAGAPLDVAETAILKEIYPKIKHLLEPKGIKAIEEQGTSVVDSDGDLTTPCVDGNKECAYVTFENGITKCGIEKGYEQGLVDWQKPISCHLYPIRVNDYKTFIALNYHEWEICNDACTLGKELEVRIYKFLKEPLIRKYGEEFYKTLCDAAEEWEKEYNS